MIFAELKQLVDVRRGFVEQRQEMTLFNEQIDAKYNKVLRSFDIYNNQSILDPQSRTMITVRKFMDAQRTMVLRGQYEVVVENYRNVLNSFAEAFSFEGTKMFKDEMADVIEYIRRLEVYITLANKAMDEVISVVNEKVTDLEKEAKRAMTNLEYDEKLLLKYEQFTDISSENMELINTRIGILQQEIKLIQDTINKIKFNKTRLLPQPQTTETTTPTTASTSTQQLVAKPQAQTTKAVPVRTKEDKDPFGLNMDTDEEEDDDE